MQFKAFEEGIEVSGRVVNVVVDGMGEFRYLGEQYMSDMGIGAMKKGKWVFDRDGWYPQQSWLDAFAAIAREMGDGMLYKIGRSIPAKVEYPAYPLEHLKIIDIHSAVRAIDVIYHINHRKNGSGCLYDPASAAVLEGIGHYSYEPIREKKLIQIVSHNPFPCLFDRGVITSLAREYDPDAIVVHDDSKACRKNGAETCTYLISERTAYARHS